MTPDIAVGAGFAFLKSSHTIPVGDSVPDVITAKAFVLPMYVNYYFHRQAEQSFFATGGIDVVFASISGGTAKQIEATFEGNGVAGVVGGGYEYRPAGGGFVFRAAPYVLVSRAGVKPWLGLSFDAAF